MDDVKMPTPEQLVRFLEQLRLLVRAQDKTR